MTPGEQIERSAALRAQADALDALAELGAKNLAAKQAYAQDMTPENKAAKRAAAEELNAVRAQARGGQGTMITGDAFAGQGG